MTINFILPFVHLTGGIRVIFEHANGLAKRGHRVRIIYPGKIFPKINAFFRIEAFLRQIKYFFFVNLLKKTEARWFNLSPKVKLTKTPSLEARYIPDADVVIATSNETASWVAAYPSEKGTKFYFIQGYEIWSREKKLVDQTFKLPLLKIVVSSWLKQLVQEKYEERVLGTVFNGVNLNQFYPVNTRKKSKNQKRILMLYHPAPHKGFYDGLKAFLFVKKKFPKIQLVLFGAQSMNKKFKLPENTEFYLNPPQDKLREIYSSCDIFLSPSRLEGYNLTPMEAMACGVAVVATNVGGIPDYTVPNKTAKVVPPKRSDLLAGALLELLNNEKELKKISNAGYRYIQKFTWEKATAKLEKLLFQGVKNGFGDNSRL